MKEEEQKKSFQIKSDFSSLKTSFHISFKIFSSNWNAFSKKSNPEKASSLKNSSLKNCWGSSYQKNCSLPCANKWKVFWNEYLESPSLLSNLHLDMNPVWAPDWPAPSPDHAGPAGPARHHLELFQPCQPSRIASYHPYLGWTAT